MDPATVQELRDTKSLLDEGILTQDEFDRKKAEILARPREGEEEGSARKKAKKTTTEEEQNVVRIREVENKGVLVTGETFKSKGVLTKLGGTWSKNLRAFVFESGSAEKVRTGLSQSSSSSLKVVVDKPISESEHEKLIESAKVSQNGNARLDVRRHKKSVLVTGETTKVKECLKANGGSWNRVLSGWIFPLNQAPRLIHSLQSDQTNTVHVDASAGAAAAPVAGAAQTLASFQEDQQQMTAVKEEKDSTTPSPPSEQTSAPVPSEQCEQVVKEEKGDEVPLIEAEEEEEETL